jgi:hypothetical protein
MLAMLVTSSDGVSMRRLCVFVLASSLWVLSSAPGGEGASALAQIIRPSSMPERQLLLEATFVCGTFDGKFGCRSVPGAVIRGKNATPGVDETKLPDVPEGTMGTEQGIPGQETVQPGEHSCPPGYRVLAVPNASGGYCEPPEGASEATNMGCEHGMVGTPPNCHCPKNSELLGGNCVHYTATCSNGLAADSAPQACAGADEKLACKMRQDGLKDCCCLTYDKL